MKYTGCMMFLCILSIARYRSELKTTVIFINNIEQFFFAFFHFFLKLTVVTFAALNAAECDYR